MIPKLHKHTYREEWSKDGEEHWHECECGNKTGVEEHKGGEADCVNKAECEICEEAYGNVDETNHTGETEIRGAVEATEESEGYTGDIHCKDCGEKLEDGEVIPKLHKHEYSEEWSKDGEEHWHECECDDKVDVERHKGGRATCVEKAECEICEEAYGNIDETNHTGEIEVRGVVEATEESEGYTGDVYCKDCGEKIEDGEVVLVIHEHFYSGGWSKDDKEHWHECECGNKADIEEHTYKDGRCTICGAEDQKDSTPVEDTAEEDTSVEGAPETSDVSTPYFYLLIMLMSLVSVGFTLRYKRK